MPKPEAVATFCDRLLDAREMDDYCPNGLQVDAGREVRRIVSGVTASLAQIEAAAAAGADMLLVHHGYFWKGESQVLTGMKGRRVRALLGNGISLLAYHLPLDRHPELGNNACLGQRLGLQGVPLKDGGLVWAAELAAPLTPAELVHRVAAGLDREPLHVDAGTQRAVRRVGWCTGAAQGYIEEAAAAGCDLFISGEVSEHTVHAARELGIHYLAAGHHATERYGVQALGDALAREFAIEHIFIEIPNPA